MYSKPKTKRYLILALAFLLLASLACQAVDDLTGGGGDGDISAEDLAKTYVAQSETARAEEGGGEDPTATDTVVPSDTLVPSLTSLPSLTTTLTLTATLPSTATKTPTATYTPTETPPPVSYIIRSGDCKNETGNVRFINNTGEIATMNLTLDKAGRTCTYFIYLVPGEVRFMIEAARYDIVLNMCGSTYYINDQPLNSNWYWPLGAKYCP